MDSFKKLLMVLFVAGAAIALSACASTKMEYAETASIDIYPGPSMQGISRYLPENTIGSRLRGGLSLGMSEKIGLDSVYNKGAWDSVEVDARYKIKYLPVWGSIDKFVKGKLFTMNIGFGIYHGIYASTGFGINTKYFELGVQSFQRFTYESFNYLAYKKQEDESLAEIKDEKNNDKLVFQYGAGAYASLFINKVTLSYNGNVYRPNKSIIINDPIPEISFATPYLFTNNFLVSYWYSDTIEFQLGVTNLLVDFNGGNWSLMAGISLWTF